MDAVLQDHGSDYHTGNLLQPDHPAVSGIPGVQLSVPGNKGRTERSNHPDFPADLQQRIPSSQDGYGKCSGMDSVHHCYDADCSCIYQPEEMGLLFG